MFNGAITMAMADISFPAFVVGMLCVPIIPFICYGIYIILRCKSNAGLNKSNKPFATTKHHPLMPPDEEVDVTGMSSIEIQEILAEKCFNSQQMMVGNVIDRDGKRFLRIEFCGEL